MGKSDGVQLRPAEGEGAGKVPEAEGYAVDLDAIVADYDRHGYVVVDDLLPAAASGNEHGHPAGDDDGQGGAEGGHQSA